MNKTNCETCGNPFPVNPPGYCGGTGYATTSDGKQICYPCADKDQVEDLKDRSKPCGGYVGKGIITTWTGGKLMTITSERPCKLARWSWIHGKSFFSIHAVDVHGGHWAGRGSEGIAIKLRPVKG